MRYTLEVAGFGCTRIPSARPADARRISTKLLELADDPFPAGVRRFQGEEDHWRIPVGDYPIIYRVEKRRVVIVIARIGHRREVYR